MMKCPACGSENPEANKFCGECAHTLANIINPSISTFPVNAPPKHIADQIIASKAIIEGENKVVTVLFADVVNYTSICEKLASETVKQIIEDCFKSLIEQVHLYEGTVDKLLGDGLMALFGAPLAHEDHAQRACHAALAMQQAIKLYEEKIHPEYGIDFKMRIGLNSGQVFVGSIGSDLKMDYTAIGDTVNLASRIQSAANPGGILVSGYTYALARDFFQFQTLGEIAIKGKEKPVSAYQLVEARKMESRFDAALTKGLSKFVGRDKEIELLGEAFTKARSGNSQVIGIMGEPGVGKSRLLREFRESLKSEDSSYLEGQCLHYGSAMPFGPLIDILKSYFGVEEVEAEIVVKGRMADKLRQLDEDMVDYLPFLFDALSLKVDDERYLRMENQYKRSKLFEAIALILAKESSDKPLVVVIEDLHWIDQASEEFLTYLMSNISNSRILLLLLYRPEYNTPWINQAGFTQIHLGQLIAPAVGELLVSLLSDGEPTSELRELVLSKTEGNPLFEEEFVHNLLDNGTIKKEGGYYSLGALASTIKLPDTVQGIIAARIDRLPDSIKSTLQVASVIGREFNYSVLQDVTRLPEELKSQLETLQKLEFIIERRVLLGIEWLFKHALIQEVAYSSLLQKKQKELHESIAKSIERLYPERLEEFSEMLAYHYQRCDLPDKAVYYLIKSAKKSLDKYNIQESQQYFKDAFNILSTKLGKTRQDELALTDLIIEWALNYYYRGDWIGLGELLTTHKSMVESIDDKARGAWFWGWLGHTLWQRGRINESFPYLQKALTLGEESGDQRATAYICAWLAFACLFRGLLKEGLVYTDRAKQLAQLIVGDDYPYFKSLAAEGHILAMLGESKKGIECGMELIRFGEQRGNLRSQAIGHFTCGFGYLMEDIKISIDYLRRGIQLSVDPEYTMMLMSHLILAYTVDNRVQDVESEIRQILAFNETHGIELFARPAAAIFGLLLITRGEMGKGLQMLSHATDLCQKDGFQGYYPILEFIQGQVYAQIYSRAVPLTAPVLIKNIGFIISNVPFARKKAILHYTKAATIFKDMEAKTYFGLTLLSLGDLYKHAGNKALAKENLLKATELFKECQAEGYLKEGESLLEALEKGK